VPSVTNINCPQCGAPADTVVRSERHVGPSFTVIRRMRRCEAGHLTLTRAHEYEEVVDTYATDLVAALQVVPEREEAVSA
jgi:transcriptional regulator NrdR family protein